MVAKTGCNSPGEIEIAFKTSVVAVSRSSADVSSWRNARTCSRILAKDDLEPYVAFLARRDLAGLPGSFLIILQPVPRLIARPSLKAHHRNGQVRQPGRGKEGTGC